VGTASGERGIRAFADLNTGKAAWRTSFAEAIYASKPQLIVRDLGNSHRVGALRVKGCPHDFPRITTGVPHISCRLAALPSWAASGHLQTLPHVARIGIDWEAFVAIAMTTGFQDALKTGDFLALRAISKSDLHNHSIGGGNRALVLEWAGRDIVPLKRPLASIAEMDAWIEGQLGSVFNGPKGTLESFRGRIRSSKVRRCYAPRNLAKMCGQIPCSTRTRRN
jgi:hypothetical protein